MNAPARFASFAFAVALSSLAAACAGVPAGDDAASGAEAESVTAASKICLVPRIHPFNGRGDLWVFDGERIEQTTIHYWRGSPAGTAGPVTRSWRLSAPGDPDSGQLHVDGILDGASEAEPANTIRGDLAGDFALGRGLVGDLQIVTNSAAEAAVTIDESWHCNVG